MVRDQALALSGLLEPQDRRPERLPAPARRASGRRRSTASAPGPPARATDRYRRGALHLLAADRAVSLDGHVRRPQPRDLRDQAGADQHAAPGVRHAERPGLRRGRPGPGAADRPRGGLERRGPRPLRPAALPVPAAPARAGRRTWSSSTRASTSATARIAQAAVALATEPLGPLPAGMDPADLAAWTTVANVLLNLDGVLTKG